MAALMEHLTEEACRYGWSQPAFLPGILGTVKDWFIFDSETVTLRPALADVFPGSGSPTAVKVHKELPVGRGCMSGFYFSPAIEHDSPRLTIDERYSGMGLLIDSTHGPRRVGDLYRVRYAIEIDNKLDKSGAQLDQIRATSESSVRIQLSAKLLHSQIVDILSHKDNLERTQNGYVTRGPLHRLALAYAVRSRHALLVTALLVDDPRTEYWNRLAGLIASDGRDPNWRKRPNVLDVLLGLTAPRGRPRKKKLADCRPSAAPYRTAVTRAAMS